MARLESPQLSNWMFLCKNQNQRIIFTALEVSCSNTLLRAGSSSRRVAWGCVQLGFEQGNSGFTTFLCNTFKYLTALILKIFPFTCLGAILCWDLHPLPLVLSFCFVKVPGKRLLAPPWGSAGQQLDPTTDCSSPSWMSPVPSASCP